MEKCLCQWLGNIQCGCRSSSWGSTHPQAQSTQPANYWSDMPTVQPNLCFWFQPAQLSTESCVTSTSATLLAAQTLSSNSTDCCKPATAIIIIIIMSCCCWIAVSKPTVGSEWCSVCNGKGKLLCSTGVENVGVVLISLFQATEPVGGYTTESVTHGQTCVYLPIHSITAVCWERHMCVNNLPRVVTWTYDLLIASPTPWPCHTIYQSIN